jgi:hypothetical protein
LESGDPELRLLLFTPHWQAYKKLKLGRVPVVASENEYWYDTPLFLKHSFHEYDKKTASALFVAIRDAWQELKDPVKLEETVDAMFNDPDYSKCLGRYVGLNLLT